MCVKKRVLSLLLAVCMTLSLLPATAYAAVGGLLGNPPERNESLLQQLEQFTGESYEEVYDLTENRLLAPGVVLERKPRPAGASAASPAYVRLQDVSKQLELLISRSRGRPNKDLAKLADQIRQVMEKWDS